MKLVSWYFLGRGGSEGLWYQSSLCFSAEKNSVRGKVMGKKWFIRIGCLWVLQMGRWEMPHPGNLLGYRFVIKGKLEGWQGELPCLSWVDVMLPHQLLLQAEQGSFLVPCLVCTFVFEWECSFVFLVSMRETIHFNQRLLSASFFFFFTPCSIGTPLWIILDMGFGCASWGVLSLTF